GGLMARREPLARLVTLALAWIAIFAGGFVLFTFRDDLGWVAQRLRAEATGAPVEQGETIRIPMAIDGHFWVDGEINGAKVKFLVDSGATMTTIGSETAARTNIAISPGRDQLVRTGGGVVRVATAYADQLSIGPIQRDGMRMHVAPGEDLNVLGMNFLSSLDRWGVEGRWLVLQP
ncbi:MAG TPA: TIGR02281 family clan AA aspartic protease, partial [Sphingomicrobium sp.]|nr:TIGR02281 family clan AA aspartic protease [Sphingomicrobium sp.]